VKLTGFNLLEKIRSIDKDFASGPPWKGKEGIIIQCGYKKEDGLGGIAPQYGAFHEAYEDARLFRDGFAEELREASEDPQELFEAFFYVREESWDLDGLEEHIRMNGIDSVLELREEILEDEMERCQEPG